MTLMEEALAMLGTDNAQQNEQEKMARLVDQGLRTKVGRIPALPARHRADGTIEFFVNRTWRNSTGLSKSKQSCEEPWIEIIHPDDRAQVEESLLTHLVGSGCCL
ncbi:PAS domain-containing protein [Bradyrhizobium sp. AZCC 2289]|uniref:PAS domain-containing protein n=1 Tax=Bradyrhizobium sp. AZCC 2289 TaxID=3117026 RepID=UPI002FF1C668